MRPNDFDINRIIEYLQGTTNTLDDAIETCFPGMEWDELIDDDHTAIDNEIFLCSTCGWWCEISDQAEDDERVEPICNDCKETE